MLILIKYRSNTLTNRFGEYDILDHFNSSFAIKNLPNDVTKVIDSRDFTRIENLPHVKTVEQAKQHYPELFI
jgi:hypothetical protein